ncbi:MAG: C39 family peptidase [Humidesulfovibrio sp.]|uniref:C39 family peptidase n=1 Tax=Humidesulfovibrio sp. TaxID=2910988 RepID=UPI002736DB23|nr:C39 family peptidase [Humidesulfovibrio sp.]MDP2849384.1 C39 family peptidase [Humidesulfovibrio sp.]
MNTRPQRVSGPPSRAVLAFLPLLALCLALCSGLWGCARLPAGFTPPPGQGQIQNVPFHAQEDHQCGPASLAMVLNHLGDAATPEEISRAIYRESLRGTLSLDLALYPRGRGFATRFFRGAPQDVADAVDAGIPLLVMVDEGFGGIHVLHYMVVTGYDPQGVLVNSGRRQGVRLSWAEFLSAWDGADRWALLLTPGKTPGKAARKERK